MTAAQQILDSHTDWSAQIAAAGELVDGDQNWDAGTTTFTFPDGSKLRFSDSGCQLIITAADLEWTWNQLGDDRFALTCTDPEATHNNIEWPSDEEVSQRVGFPVRFVDSGDHPTLVEGIYRSAS